MRSSPQAVDSRDIVEQAVQRLMRWNAKVAKKQRPLNPDYGKKVDWT